jgi:hypothetical protein
VSDLAAFSAAQQQVSELIRQRGVGVLSAESFDQQLELARYVNHDQVWWSLSGDGASWYRYDGASWIADRPPSGPPAPWWTDPAARLRFLNNAATTAATQKWWGGTAGAVARAMADQAVAVISAFPDTNAVIQDADNVMEQVVAAMEEQASRILSVVELGEAVTEELAGAMGLAVTDELADTIGQAVADAYRVATTGLDLSEDRVVVALGATAPGYRTDRVTGQRVSIDMRNAPERTLINPLILLVDGPVTSPVTVQPAIAVARSQGRPLLLVAREFEKGVPETLASMQPAVDAVSPVGVYGDRRSAIFEDLAVVTGGRVAANESEARGVVLGSAMVARLAHDDVTIVHAAGNRAALSAHIRALQAKLDASISTYERDKLEQRTQALSAGVVVISVGDPLPLGRVQLGVEIAEWVLRLGLVPAGGVVFQTAQEKLPPPRSRSPGGAIVDAALGAANQVLGGRQFQPRATAIWIVRGALWMVEDLVRTPEPSP